MSINIFYHQDDSREEWLEINNDGSATYTREADGLPLIHRGPRRKEQIMTADEAKRRFPDHTQEIDLALKQIGDIESFSVG